MAYVVRMPQMGMSMDEGLVVAWEFDEGESVEEGDTIVVVESEKASNEVEARENASLRRIIVPEGESVEPGDPIGIVAKSDEEIADLEDDIEDPLDDGAGGTEPTTASSSSEDGGTCESNSGADAPSNVRATPGARQRAQTIDIDLSRVKGTGPQGVITEGDVEDHVNSDESSNSDGGATQTVAETRTFSNVQQTISDRLGESYREAVHVTLNRSFDTTSLQETVSAAKLRSADVSISDVLIRAVADTLEAYPEFNAVYEDGEHKLIEEVNVGVAIDIDDGLVTPVIPSVSEKSMDEIRSVRTDLTESAKSGAFTMDDLSGGTFTISNLGVLGVDDFDPVINPPQIAILGVGRIRNDDTMTLSLSFDHRVVNGADAARFLDSLTETLTDASALAAFFDDDLQVETDLDDREIRVQTDSGFQGSYRTGAGEVAFDEPEAVGGTGTAPSPIDHLLGALGSCLSLSVRQMAERDDVAVGSLSCSVTGSPDHGPVKSVVVELELETDADEAAVDKLTTKAERACYVARSLSDDVTVGLSWKRA